MLGGGRCSGFEEPVGVGDRFGDVDEFASVALGAVAEEFEGLLFVDVSRTGFRGVL